ncbi:hypothetical protein IFM89_019111 [Coptis chinensis]|uniref:Uncharacterized protein n=1 Tax=Coptis chinensis TaxID=261450 RepID=A0A835HWU6_9MAGN|nr:hypothetical protein IFM89_019111 [Coptis chinensis]
MERIQARTKKAAAADAKERAEKVLRDLENSRTLRGKLKKDEERDWIATNVHRSARSVEISFSLFVCVYDYLYLSSYKCRKPIQVH